MKPPARSTAKARPWFSRRHGSPARRPHEFDHRSPPPARCETPIASWRWNTAESWKPAIMTSWWRKTGCMPGWLSSSSDVDAGLRANPSWSLVDDVPGVHDTLGGCLRIMAWMVIGCHRSGVLARPVRVYGTGLGVPRPVAPNHANCEPPKVSHTRIPVTLAQLCASPWRFSPASLNLLTHERSYLWRYWRDRSWRIVARDSSGPPPRN